MYKEAGWSHNRLISHHCTYNVNSTAAGSLNESRIYSMYTENLTFSYFGGTRLITALGKERFNRRLEQLLHHCAFQTSMKYLACLVSQHSKAQQTQSNSFETK